MNSRNEQAMFGRRFGHHVWRLVRTYWSSRDARPAVFLLAGAVALELATVLANVALAGASRRIGDALQDRHATSFFAAIALYGAISAGFVLVSTFRIYLRQLVEIRWRRGLTADYVERWMNERAYCQVQLHPHEIDNPDQRIAEDVRDFVASALGLSLSMLSALVTLVSFGGVLWRLSGGWMPPIGGTQFRIPGFLFWVALAYALVSTWLTHVVGRRLVPLNFDRLRYEANFRYGLMRFRDNVELVTLSRGAALERRGALERFASVVQNWRELVGAQRNLAMFTGVVGQANGMIPVLAAVPAFFAGVTTLGTIAEIRIAYDQVSGAFGWFINAYQEIARWRANIERLSTFTEVIDETEKDLAGAKLAVVRGKESVLRLKDLRLDSCAGEPLIEGAYAAVAAGERVAITGPPGSGKTMLLRAIAGIWPFGSGRIELPPDARIMFVPQWPYLPHDTMRAVVSYPASAGTFPDDAIRDILALLGLDRLMLQLDATEPWDQQLSPHEQQRVAFARVLLNRPDWVFLDKATSSLDDDTEKRIYELLAERLPHATVISVTHSPAVAALHPRRWTLSAKPHGPSLLEAA